MAMMQKLYHKLQALLSKAAQLCMYKHGVCQVSRMRTMKMRMLKIPPP